MVPGCQTADVLRLLDTCRGETIAQPSRLPVRLLLHSHASSLLMPFVPKVAAAAAFKDTGAVVTSRTGVLLMGSICIIAWLNLR